MAIAASTITVIIPARIVSVWETLRISPNKKPCRSILIFSNEINKIPIAKKLEDVSAIAASTFTRVCDRNHAIKNALPIPDINAPIVTSIRQKKAIAMPGITVCVITSPSNAIRCTIKKQPIAGQIIPAKPPAIKAFRMNSNASGSVIHCQI